MDNTIILIITFLVLSIVYYIYIYKKQIEKFETYNELNNEAKEALSKKIRGINTNPTDPQHKVNNSEANTITKKDAGKTETSSNINMDDYIPKYELSKYILKSELKSSDIIDKSKYILKSAIKPNKLVDKNKYILKSEIKPPKSIDLNKYILKSEIKSSSDLDISKYVLKTDLRIPINITDSLRNINQQVIKPDISIDELNNSNSIDKLSTCLNLKSSKQDSKLSKEQSKKEHENKIDEINKMNKQTDRTIHVNDIKVPENKNVFNMPLPKLNVVELPVLNQNTRQLSTNNTVKNVENQFIFPSLGTVANPIQITKLDYPKGCVKSRRVIANRDAFVAY